MRKSLFAIGICAVLSVVCPRALGDPSLELRLPAASVVAGAELRVELYAVEDAASPGETIGRIETIIDWDDTKLSLDCATGVDTTGAFAWASSKFPSGGLNAVCSDGKAMYQALASGSCTPVMTTSASGELVATIVFTALVPTDPATTSIGLLSSYNDGSTTYNTRVWDAETLFCGGVQYSTTPLGSPVDATITACSIDGDCGDGDACTDDTCDTGSGVCSNTPNYTVGVECCDPADGSVTTIDDQNDCTSDSCNPSTGNVTHTNRAFGTACGDQTDTTCTDPDTCDGAGTCLSNHATDGTVCNDQVSCTATSSCQSGVCTATSNEPAGTSCDDGLDCTTSDQCDGNGTCVGGPDPCTDPSFPYCTEADDPGTGNPYTCVECLSSSDCVDPDPGDCLVSFCFVGTCNLSQNDNLCQDSQFCNGSEVCNASGVCDPASNPDPCSGTPATPVCDEANDRCVECTSDAHCDDDPCLLETCDVASGTCNPTAPPVDCSSLNTDCSIGVCNATTGVCESKPVENVSCVDDADCSFYEPTRYRCVQNICQPATACSDGDDCTTVDSCLNGVCAGEPPVSDGPVDLVLNLATPSTVLVGETVQIDMIAQANDGGDHDMTGMDAVLGWSSSALTLTSNFDPCTSAPCPAGQYDWNSSGFPTGSINDPDDLNASHGDGDALYRALTRPCPGPPCACCGCDCCGPGECGTAPILAAQDLWVTTFEFSAVGYTGPAGTDIELVLCAGTNPTLTQISGDGAGVVITGSLGSAHVVVLECNTSAECDDFNECTDNVCDANGQCQYPPKSAGTTCGSPANSDCDNPDTCDGAGVCQSNAEPSGTACTPDSNECTQDICDGAGTCTHPNEPFGEPCGDGSTTDCSFPDSCDGSGNCDPNHRASGTACGDSFEGPCDHADTCDGAGQCLDNLEPPGTSCDDGVFCSGIETCDAFGVCQTTGPPCDLCTCTIHADCPSGPCIDNVCLDVTECPCQEPLVTSVGPRFLAITPQPPDANVPVRLVVTSPDWPCLFKYVGFRRCVNGGQLCGSDDDCATGECNNDINIKCRIDGDCPPGGTCVGADTCGPGPGTRSFIDINNDGFDDGVIGTLVADEADAAMLTSPEWGASLNRCSLTVKPCTVDEDCDRGLCDVSGTPCSVSQQSCANACSISETACSNDGECFGGAGDTCSLTQTCVPIETCEPGKVYVFGSDIVPTTKLSDGTVIERVYSVQADCGSLTPPTSAPMWKWSDADNSGVANFSDVFLAIRGFQGVFGLGDGVPSSLAGTDVAGDVVCVPQLVVNFSDVQRMIKAFQGETYEEAVTSEPLCDMPCP